MKKGNKKYKKIQAAFLIGTFLSLGGFTISTQAAQPPAETTITDPNAAVQQPVADPNAAAVQPPVADPNAAAIQPPATDPNTAQSATDPNAVQPQQNTSNQTKSQKKKTQSKISLSAEQIKQDIENSLEKDAKDAILNGYLSLLNKDYILKDELDLELTNIGNGYQLEPKAAAAYTKMIQDAKKKGLYINVTSSYRTYAKQVALFKNKIERLERGGSSHEEAVKGAGMVVAIPGTSEHQLGLSVDFLTNKYRNLDEGIKNTKEYKWVEEYAWEYGYVIRYPQGKSSVTGIISEPWHLRYVGIPAAKLISEQGICLEEFLGVAYDGQKNGISYGAGWANTGR